MRYIILLFLTISWCNALKAQSSLKVKFTCLEVPDFLLDPEIDSYELKLDIPPEAYKAYALSESEIRRLFSLSSFNQVGSGSKLRVIVSLAAPSKNSRVTSIVDKNGKRKFTYDHQYTIPNGVKVLGESNNLIYEEKIGWVPGRNYFISQSIYSPSFDSELECRKYFSVGGKGYDGILVNYQLYGSNTVNVLASKLKENFEFKIDTTYEMVLESPEGENEKVREYRSVALRAAAAYSTIKAGEDRTLFMKKMAVPIAFWRHQLDSLERSAIKSSDQKGIIYYAATNLSNAYLWSDKIDSAKLALEKLATVDNSSNFRSIKMAINRRQHRLDQLKKYGLDPYKVKGNIVFEKSSPALKE